MFGHFNFLIILSLSSLFIFSSCSTTKRNYKKGDQQTKASLDREEQVTREKYMALLEKYKQSNPNDPQIKEFELQKASTLPKAMEGGAVETVSTDANLMKELKKVESNPGLIESVDVFPTVSKKNVDQANITKNQKMLRDLVEDETVEQQLGQILQAEQLVYDQKYNDALIILRELEVSPVLQIKVRAKFLLGEILFAQNEFDLAMQIYEEIVSKYAFSSAIIKVLGKLVICSEKLNLPNKQQKYYSILHDLFGYEKKAS